MSAEILNTADTLLGYMMLLSLQLVFIVALRRPVVARFGARAGYLLWALPLLWLPLSLLDWSAAADWLTLALSTGTAGQVQGWFLAPITVLAEIELPLPSLAATTDSRGWLLALVALWSAGASLLLGMQLWRINRFQHYLRKHARPVAPDVLPSGYVPAIPVLAVPGLGGPALFGAFRPRLLLPHDFAERFDAEQLQLMLAHEAVHLRRRDNVWNALAAILRAVYWPNPLLHWAHRLFRLDQELACDAAALDSCTPQQGRRYARTLLETAGGRTVFTHAPVLTAWDNLHDLKKRTAMIGRHLELRGRRGVARYAAAVILLSGLVVTAWVSDTLGPLPEVAAAEIPAEAMSPAVRAVITEAEKLRNQSDMDGARAVMLPLQEQALTGELNASEAFGVWMNFGSIAQAEGNFAEAIDYYDRAIAVPGLAEARESIVHSLLGGLHAALGQHESAADHYENVVDVDGPRGTDAAFRLALAYSQMPGRFDDAVVMARRAVADRPTYEASHARYGLLLQLLQQTGDQDAAAEVLRDMVEIFDRDDEREALRNYLQTGTTESFVPSSGVTQQAAAEYLPVFTRMPQYPRQAVEDKVEGWAQVSFTVTPEGAVADAVVVDAKPADIFDSAALKAISEFRFVPRTMDGTPQAVPGVQYVFRFNLAED